MRQSNLVHHRAILPAFIAGLLLAGACSDSTAPDNDGIVIIGDTTITLGDSADYFLRGTGSGGPCYLLACQIDMNSGLEGTTWTIKPSARARVETFRSVGRIHTNAVGPVTIQASWHGLTTSRVIQITGSSAPSTR